MSEEKYNEIKDDSFKSGLLVRFGKNLEEILVFLLMNQTEFCNRANINPAVLSNIINGKQEANLSTIVKILQVIPVKFERLIK